MFAWMRFLNQGRKDGCCETEVKNLILAIMLYLLTFNILLNLKVMKKPKDDQNGRKLCKLNMMP
jgi:hypothetical protein